jgi:phage baseplate assembly protein W
VSSNATSTGIDRHTGRVLTGWPHVVQCLGVIWTTALGERVMREFFGNPGLRLLGENLTDATVLRFWQCLKVVTDRFEPRFTISRISLGPNSAETMRRGEMSFVVEGIYRPRGHLGDRTPEAQSRVVSLGANGVIEA